jgi:KDO2-lipid IV(A) lauroyltransferase
MLGAMGGLAGMELTIVTRRITPAWLLRKMENVRLSVNVKAAYQPRTLPVVLKALRRGETIGFVIDQYASPPMGVKVNFFGVDVDTLSAVAPLSLRTGAPIVPVRAHRDKKGVIHVTMEPELQLGDTLKDPKQSTQIIANKVEEWIRQYPEQWLWVHRRFKNID